MTKRSYTTSFLLVLAMSLAVPAHALSITWDGSLISNNWDAGFFGNRNWASFLLPATTDDVAFPGTAADFIVDLNGDRTVVSATFSGGSGYTLNDNTLTLSSGNLTVTGTATHTINSDVQQVGFGGSWSIDDTSSLSVNGIVSGDLLTKKGTGTLTLNGANTYAFGTSFIDGTISVGNSAGLGSGLVSMGFSSSPVTLLLNTGNINLGNNISVSAAGAGTVTLGTTSFGGGQSSTLSGSLTLGRDVTFQAEDDLTHSGIISESGGTGSITKNGTGVLTLTGANTYTGGTTIDGGTLSLGNSAAAGTGTITVLGSTIDYADTINVNNSIDLQNNATLNVSTGSATQSGPIGETSGPWGITKTGVGHLILPTANTFTGATIIDGGSLILDNANAQQNSAVTINVNGGLDVTTNSVDATLGGLTANANLDISPQTLTVKSTTTVNNGGTINVGAGTLRAMDDVSISGGTIDVDGGSLNASGLTNQAGNSVALSGVSALLDVDSGGLVDLNGGGGGLGETGGQGGAFTMTDGTFMLRSGATLQAQGGASGGLGFGDVGSVSFSGGTSALDGTVTLLGRNGIVGSGDGHNGGDVTVSGTASVTLSGTINLKGGNGSSLLFNDGGNGGDLNIEGGAFTMDSAAATLDLTGGSTGGAFGDPGATGVVNVSGGTLTLNAGLIRGGSGTPSADPVNLIGADINITNTGSVNVGGNMTINGGLITRGSDSNSFDLASGLTLMAKNNAQINFGGDYSIGKGTTFDIQSGADFSTVRFLDIGVENGDGTLVVDGADSSVTISAGPFVSTWGNSVNTADVTFRNGATGNLGGINLAQGTVGGSTATGIINVESGATVTTRGLRVAIFGGATTSGTITVDGGSSSLTQSGSSTLTLGHTTDGTATINVQNGGTFTTGTGTTTVNATGTININGKFNANGNLIVDGGTINRTGGNFLDSDTNGTYLSISHCAERVWQCYHIIAFGV